MTKYDKWIKRWCEANQAYGGCAKAATELVEAFPELTAVKGHAYTDWGKRAHWWTTTAEGKVIDPTASQFGVVFEYEPWESGSEVLVGKCMDCGAEIWVEVQTLDEPPPQQTFCDEACQKATEAYLNKGLG